MNNKSVENKRMIFSDAQYAHAWAALKAKLFWYRSRFVNSNPTDRQYKTRYRNPVYRMAYVVHHDRCLIKEFKRSNSVN